MLPSEVNDSTIKDIYEAGKEYLLTFYGSPLARTVATEGEAAYLPSAVFILRGLRIYGVEKYFNVRRSRISDKGLASYVAEYNNVTVLLKEW